MLLVKFINDNSSDQLPWNERNLIIYIFFFVLPNILPDLDPDFEYNIVLGVFKILWSHLEIRDQFFEQYVTVLTACVSLSSRI